ncbi:MAG: cyclic nucleotide-binding domain-containing protein [Afipia sp.]|nr:cyclic nucleotide-binding domain-containing protein [Afipia sp.]
MRPNEIALVRSLPLFLEVSDDSLSRLLKDALLQQFPVGTVLLQEGDPPDFLHVLLEGLVEIFSQQGDSEAGISLLTPVSTFILAAIIADQPYLNSARTLAKSRVLLIPAKLVHELFDEDVAFARVVAHELALAYRSSVKKLKGHMARSSVERLANWVLAEANRHKTDASLVIPFDRGTLASHIGTTRENLSRSLAHLTDHGIRIRGREIVIENKSSLETFAKPQKLIDDPAS